MKLYQIPMGLCKQEYAKAILIGLSHCDLLMCRTDDAQVLLDDFADEGFEGIFSQALAEAIESGSIRCDRSWDSPPDDTLVSLAAYAQGKEPPAC